MNSLKPVVLMSLTEPLVQDPPPETPPVPAGSNPPKPKKKRILLKVSLSVLGMIVLTVVLALTVFKDNVDHLVADYYFSQKDYETAQAKYQALGDFQDSLLKKDEATFYIAKAQMEDGKYSTACITLNGIRVLDSVALYKECVYLWAAKYYEDKNYTEALKKYGLIPGYKDVVEMVKIVTYDMAKAYYDEADYDSAAVYYFNLGTYKDADKLYHYTLFMLANQRADTDKMTCDCAIVFGEPAVTVELYDLRAALVSYDYPESVLYDDIFWNIILKGSWKNSAGYVFNYFEKNGQQWMTYNIKYKTFDYWTIHNNSVWMNYDDGRAPERWIDITFTSSTTIEILNHLDNITYHLKKDQ
jgi:tetratricopeptide (TPR) repeat protein